MSSCTVPRCLRTSLLTLKSSTDFVSSPFRKYEGRKPALLDNLVQALFLAPLFVWYEVLFSMGLYGGLKKEVEGLIEVEVGKMKGGKKVQ
jgi:uncharacterized membrane protein YGL010W